MSFWTSAMVAANSAVAAPTSDDAEREGRMVEENMSAGNHVNAGGDHGCGVDERGHRRGAFHGIREPDIEGKLRALSGCAKQQAQGNRGEHSALPGGICAELGSDLAERERAEVGQQQKHADQEPKSPMRLTMKALLPAFTAESFLK